MFYIFKYISNFFFNIIVILLNFFWERDENIILVGSWMGEKFADNSRYLYQYLHYNKEKTSLKEVVWVTRNRKQLEELKQKGYNCVYMHSIKSYYYHVKSGKHIVCNVPHQTKMYKGDILGELSFGAKKIQLWHGVPLKGVGGTIKSIENSKKSSLLQSLYSSIKANYFFLHFIHASGGWDEFVILSTSKEVSLRFEKIFNIPSEFIVQSSYPRNCECLEYLNEEKIVLEKISKKSKVILYLPTFRNSKATFSYPLEINSLIEVIMESDILWIEKPHSADNFFKSKSSNENILFLESIFDVNVIIPYVDLIITDYSSVSFDGIFFDVPIIYYVPDLSNYLLNDRGFTSDFEKNTVGDKISNVPELIESIKGYFKDRVNIEKSQKIKRDQVKSLIYDNRQAKYQEIVRELKIVG